MASASGCHAKWVQTHADRRAGAYEVRIKVQGQWRVIYVAKHKDAVYVLHCFQKTTPKTAKADVDLAGKLYKLIGA